jgi:hypothetical protein
VTAPARDSAGCPRFLRRVEDANPGGQIVIVTGNLSGHDSRTTRAWPESHPRLRQVFIPGACRLNLAEGWWRLFRKTALAGQTFTDADEITFAARPATARLNTRARPWRWGRPRPKTRTYRRRFAYAL